MRANIKCCTAICYTLRYAHSPLVVQSSSLSLSDESDDVWSLHRRGKSLVNSGDVWGVVTVGGAVVWSTVELGGAGCEGV